MAETIFAHGVQRLPKDEWYPKQSIGRLMSDGTGRRALAFRHPDQFVEAVRFAVCEGEILQAVGRGRGVRRSTEGPLQVLILTNVPIPIPIDQITAWIDLCAAGPFDSLMVHGVVPLDYAGIAASLPQQFADAVCVKDWFQYRPDARSTFKSIHTLALAQGYVVMSDFSGILHNDSTMDDSAKLIAYRYRRQAGSRQRAAVLVDDTMHADPRAAVEAVLGPVEHFARVEKPTPRRRTRRETSMNAVTVDFDQLFGPRNTDTTRLPSFGSKSAS
jgi:hypothetical protein